MLTHTKVLPARVIGYLSTSHGVAIDYDPPPTRTASDRTTFEVLVGHDRIEHLVLQKAGAPPQMLRSPPVKTVPGGGFFQFIGIHLVGWVSVGESATAVFDRCLFSWPSRLHGEWTLGTSRLEVFGDSSSTAWTKDRAVGLAKDEVLAALFELNRANAKHVTLPEYYAKHKKNTVLILGSYSDDGIERLRQFERELSRLGLEPVLLIDVPDQEAQTLEQKVVMVGSLSRFVVVDDTEKSGHLTELRLCKDNGWLTIVLCPDGKASSAMSIAPGVLSNVIHEVSYNIGDPPKCLKAATEWAETKRAQIHAQLRNGYPWSIIP
jgi:hypothetical protein